MLDIISLNKEGIDLRGLVLLNTNVIDANTRC